MKVALVYDRVNKWGGAERVLLALKELFPEAPLYTSVYHPKKAAWAKNFIVKTSFLQNFPFASVSHELYAPLMPLAFEHFSFEQYDLVISVTSEAAKGIITKPHTKHICICLTPTRYLWSGYKEYFKNSFFRFLTKPLIRYLQMWDTIASRRPDFYIAISEEVQKRIKKYYQQDSTVVYPPLMLTRNNQQQKIAVSKNQKKYGFFLVVSRLVSIKRIDLAVKACNMLKVPLKIVGSGLQEKRLRKLAGPTIEFLGNLTDEELMAYYTDCCALLFPGIEDFGLTPVEAQSFGKPVIALKAGGTLETVISGKTGEFFYPQTEKALANIIEKLLKTNKVTLKESEQTFYQEACIQNARRFDKKIFQQQVINFVKKIHKEKEI